MSRLLLSSSPLPSSPPYRAAASRRRSAATCTPPKYPGSGYFTSLSVTKVTCATGKKVALAFHKCRTKNGRQGPLRGEGRGLRLHREAHDDLDRDQRPRHCKRGTRKVLHTYQQN